MNKIKENKLLSGLVLILLIVSSILIYKVSGPYTYWSATSDNFPRKLNLHNIAKSGDEIVFYTPNQDRIGTGERYKIEIEDNQKFYMKNGKKLKIKIEPNLIEIEALTFGDDVRIITYKKNWNHYFYKNQIQKSRTIRCT